MSYLLSQLWLFLLLSAILGLAVGWWARCSSNDCNDTGRCEGRGKLVFWLVVLAALIGAMLALTKTIAGRYGFYLEVALLLLAAYLVGCVLGCLIGSLFCRGRTASVGATPFVSAAAVTGGVVADAATKIDAAQTTASQTIAAVVPVADAPDMQVSAIPVPEVAAPEVSASELPDVPAPVVDAAPVGLGSPEIAAPAATLAHDFDNDPTVIAAKPEGFAAPQGGKKDDLKRIRGIGRVNEARLNELGIFHFSQIAAWLPEQCKWVNQLLAFPGRIQREDWVGQAKLLAEGKETTFSKRVDKGDVPTSL